MDGGPGTLSDSKLAGSIWLLVNSCEEDSEYGTMEPDPWPLSCSTGVGNSNCNGVLEGIGRVGDSHTTSARVWLPGVCDSLKLAVDACDGWGSSGVSRRVVRKEGSSQETPLSRIVWAVEGCEWVAVSVN